MRYAITALISSTGMLFCHDGMLNGAGSFRIEFGGSVAIDDHVSNRIVLGQHYWQARYVRLWICDSFKS